MFIRNNFQFNRGIPNCQAQGQDLTSILHTYISATDIAATILTTGYFPDYFEEVETFVVPGDTILITAADTVVMSLVLDTAPVVLSANLFNLSPSILVGLPVAATNLSALVLSAGILRAQIADPTHPGIVTEVAQTFSADKKFLGQMYVVGGSDMPGPVDLVSNGLRVQGDASTIGLDILMLNNSQIGTYVFNTQTLGSFGGMIGSAAGFIVAEPQVQIGCEGSEIIFGESGIYCNSDFNVDLINGFSGNVVTINSFAGANTIVSGFTLNSTGGLTFPSGSAVNGGTMTNFKNVDLFTFNWGGAWLVPRAGKYSLQLINGMVTIDFSGLSALDATATSAIISAAGIIPAYARPIVNKTKDILVHFENGSPLTAIGLVTVSTAGTVTITSDIAGAPFDISKEAGMFDFSITYNLQY